MIALCNPVAKKPYMNLRLNNVVTDTGTGGNTPSNTGVAFTTDQFGRTNMAGNWDANTDTLALSSTISDTLRGFVNNSFTLIVNLYPTDLTTTRRIITVGNSDFGIGIQNYSTYVKCLQFYTYQYISTLAVKRSANDEFTENNWYNVAIKTSDNTTDLKLDGYKNADSIINTNIDKANYDSNSGASVGNHSTGSSTGSYRGKMNNLRIYDITLTDGQIKILNNQKGRIVA